MEMNSLIQWTAGATLEAAAGTVELYYSPAGFFLAELVNGESTFRLSKLTAGEALQLASKNLPLQDVRNVFPGIV